MEQARAEGRGSLVLPIADAAGKPQFILRLLAGLMLMPLSPSTIQAHEIKLGDLVIVHPMVDVAEKDQASAKGSVQIRNEGPAADRLLSVRAPFAETATIATVVPVPIPATGRAVSVAIVFTNLRQSLYEDAAYAGQLVFDRAGTVEIDFMVHSGSH